MTVEKDGRNRELLGKYKPDSPVRKSVVLSPNEKLFIFMKFFKDDSSESFGMEKGLLTQTQIQALRKLKISSAFDDFLIYLNEIANPFQQRGHL